MRGGLTRNCVKSFPEPLLDLVLNDQSPKAQGNDIFFTYQEFVDRDRLQIPLLHWLLLSRRI